MVYSIWVIGRDELPISVADLLRGIFKQATIEVVPVDDFRDKPGTADLAVITNYDLGQGKNAIQLMASRPDFSYLWMVSGVTRPLAQHVPSHISRQIVDKPANSQELAEAVTRALCI
ncbi:MAG: hypothetical protein WCV50_01520 [Patescibacteria group bacterium]|jgi:hypothetical protein